MASSSRALNAILPQIATAPYEAHQKARTFAARYVKSNQLDAAIEEAGGSHPHPNPNNRSSSSANNRQAAPSR